MASDISKCISSNSVRHGSSLVLAPDKTALTNNIITDHTLTNPSVSSIETRLKELESKLTVLNASVEGMETQHIQELEETNRTLMQRLGLKKP